MLNIADRQRAVVNPYSKSWVALSALGQTRSDKRNSYRSLKSPDMGRNKINILKCVASAAAKKKKKVFFANISTRRHVDPQGQSRAEELAFRLHEVYYLHKLTDNSSMKRKT